MVAVAAVRPVAPPVLTKEVVLHDQFNLLVLPIIGTAVLGGLLGFIDTMLVTKSFIAYIVADFLWILVEPRAVPSKPKMILWHHIATFLLLLIPLRHPELGRYTCADGLIEWNTFFLVARRQWPRYYRVFNSLYWATFHPLRLILFPVLVPLFYWEMQNGYPKWEMVAVVGAQALLCLFNGWFFVQSLLRRR